MWRYWDGVECSLTSDWIIVEPFCYDLVFILLLVLRLSLPLEMSLAEVCCVASVLEVILVYGIFAFVCSRLCFPLT